jgi:ABC-2 type transport system permease protein
MLAGTERINERLRIISTIAVKDAVDALKNKTIVTVMIGLALMTLTSQALPLLLKLSRVPVAIVYDPGKSDLVTTIADEDGYSLRRLPSQDEMESWIGEGSEVMLGLTLPADLDEQVDNGGSIKLEGAVVHWAEQAKVTELVDFFEDRFSEAAGRRVSIEIEDDMVYPPPDAGGRPFMASMGFVIATIMVGAFLVPYLMIEERETHTMDSLLVSPATYSEVVAGKALAGTFYCLAALTVMFAFNLGLINLWGLALLAAVCGALFTVAVGLLMGTLFDNAASLNLWLGLVIMILLVPVFLEGTMGSNFPELMRTIMPWIPSVALAEVFRTSFSNDFSAAMIISDLGIVVAAAALILALVVWRVRQSDR